MLHRGRINSFWMADQITTPLKGEGLRYTVAGSTAFSKTPISLNSLKKIRSAICQDCKQKYIICDGRTVSLNPMQGRESVICLSFRFSCHELLENNNTSSSSGFLPG